MKSRAYLRRAKSVKNWVCSKFSYEPRGSLAAYAEKKGIVGVGEYVIDHSAKVALPLVGPFVTEVVRPFVNSSSWFLYRVVDIVGHPREHPLYWVDTTVGVYLLLPMAVLLFISEGLDKDIDKAVRYFGKKFNYHSKISSNIC